MRIIVAQEGAKRRVWFRRCNARAFRDGKSPASTIWLWFVAAFLLQLGAWAAWFAIAANHQVAEVPLAIAR